MQASSIGKRDLWIFNVEFGYAGTQGTAIETKDFRGAVFAANFPVGLLQHMKNVVPARSPSRVLLAIEAPSLAGFLSSSARRSFGPDD